MLIEIKIPILVILLNEQSLITISSFERIQNISHIVEGIIDNSFNYISKALRWKD